ncbi:recombinase family protein [Rhodococcus sp. NPDC060176]|uniref:recombinase family protein n=1 Tax=Rhodococcus sp. NPDC060176 TaxID=3347062 RepID=UPI00365D0931
MRAIIYTRVSADNTGLGRSVGEQEAECRTLCDREGWDVAKVLQDNDIGASRWSGKTRPEYKRLRDVLKKGDVLVTWEASRAQRDLDAYVQLRDLCAERGVLWSYSGKTFDLSKGDDRFSTGLDALLAEREADLIRERVLRAMRSNLASGRPHGKTPYGYARVNTPSGKLENWVPNEPEAEVLREIVRRILAGDSVRSIVKDLNSRELPGPGGKVWHTSSLSRLAKNPVYAGLRTHYGVVHGPGIWDGLISNEDHIAVASLLTGRATHDRGSEPRHLLSGIATCGVCGAFVRRGHNRGIEYYQCKENFCIARVKHQVDAMVTKAVIRWLEEWNEGASERSDDTSGASELADLRMRLEEFTQSAIDGGITSSTFAKIESSLTSKIAELEQLLVPAHVEPVADLIGLDAAENWKAVPMARKRAIVRSRFTVKIKATTMGPEFDTESVEIDWTTAPRET